jgi:hypothetical protein
VQKKSRSKQRQKFGFAAEELASLFNEDREAELESAKSKRQKFPGRMRAK